MSPNSSKRVRTTEKPNPNPRKKTKTEPIQKTRPRRNPVRATRSTQQKSMEKAGTNTVQSEEDGAAEQGAAATDEVVIPNNAAAAEITMPLARENPPQCPVCSRPSGSKTLVEVICNTCKRAVHGECQAKWLLWSGNQTCLKCKAPYLPGPEFFFFGRRISRSQAFGGAGSINAPYLPGPEFFYFGRKISRSQAFGGA